MPFKDTWSDDGHDLHESRERVYFLMDLLCDVCKLLDSDPPLHMDEINGLDEWWKAYQEHESKQKAKEQSAVRRAEQFASAYRKLTPEEREAIGLPEGLEL